jgi:regulator of sirC expression with transglutaminase-like and TPR domain
VSLAEAESRTQALARLKSFGLLDDGAIDLADAALLLASLDHPDPQLEDCRLRLAQIGAALAKTEAGRGDERLAARAEALRAVLAEGYGFLGDRHTYDDLENANLISVIERRRGLPVALSILYIDAARRLGWPIEGLNFPGRFMIRLAGSDGRAVLDPFDGGEIRDAAALRELLKRGAGPDAELMPEHFAPVGNRDILLRLQNNIKVRLLQGGAVDKALAILERMLLVAPNEPLLWLEAAGHYAGLGKLRSAVEAATTCCRLARGESLGHRAEALLAELRGKLN